jgi:hypothetical protein
MERALIMMAIKTRVAHSSCRNEYECLIVFVLSVHSFSFLLNSITKKHPCPVYQPPPCQFRSVLQAASKVPNREIN